MEEDEGQDVVRPRLPPKIVIDPELAALLPALKPEEREQLKANIEADGQRDPIVVWPQADGSLLIVDGHHRYEIRLELGKEPKFVERDFASREEAKR